MTEETLFELALKTPTAERAALLDRACEAMPELRERVEKLLAAHEARNAAVDGPLQLPPTVDVPPQPEDRVDQTVGRYRLLQKLGEGGMGAVWAAEQTHPVKRRVALKLIKAGMDSARIVARFEAERQALAMMDHPCIAKVLDAGTTPDGRPYFAMELVKGVPITKYCDEVQATIRERLELFVQTCGAVQHAHQKGIIHRDLKPSNILVAMHDGVAGPKVIDFGVAKALHSKLVEQTLYTEIGQVIGTLEYMAPEQAELSAMDIDTRADVYALGVLLFELLAGSTPITRERLKKAGYAEILRVIKEEEPPRPSTRLSASNESLPNLAARRRMEPKKLAAALAGELDWIALKALEKNRARRYETANALAADVRRYLADEPVEARPPSRAYRMQKFARKHRAALTTAIAIALLLVAGVAVSSWQALRATKAEAVAQDERAKAVTERDEKEKARAASETAQKAEAVERRRAEDALTRSEAVLYFSRINLAYQYWQGNQLSQANHILSECPQSLRNWEWNYLHRLCHSDLLTLPGNGQFTTRLRFSRDGKRMAAVANSGLAGVRVWDLTTNKSLAELNLSSGHSFRTGTISPDGTLLAMGDRNGAITLWDAATAKRLRELGRLKGDIGSLDFSPDGKWLAAARTDYKRGSLSVPLLEPARNEAFKVWSVASGEEVATKLSGLGVAAEFSPDGKRLLAFKKNPALRLTPRTPEYLCVLVDTTTWKEERTLGPADSWTFNADGSLLALGGRDDEGQPVLKGIDPVTGKEKFAFTPKLATGDIALSPDGRILAVAQSWGSTIDIWSVNERRLLRTLRGHVDKMNAIAFAPDGRLVSCNWDNTIKFWDVNLEQAVQGLPGKGARVVTNAAFSPDGDQVAWVQGDNVGGGLFASGTLGTVTLWDPELGKIIHEMHGHTDGARRVAFSADGRLLASGARDQTVRSWDVAQGKNLATFRGHQGYIEALAVSPDGRWVASAHLPNETRDAGFGKGTFKRIPGEVKVWDARNGQERLTLTGHPDRVKRLAFSPDGTLLASYSPGVLKFWDLATGKERQTIPTNTGWDGLLFSPDGTQLVTLSESITYWEVATGQRRQVVRVRSAGAGRGGSAVLSRDGRRLLTAHDREVKLWDTMYGQEILTLPLRDGERPGAGPSVEAVSFSKDGRRILAAMFDGTVQRWDGTP